MAVEQVPTYEEAANDPEIPVITRDDYASYYDTFTVPAQGKFYVAGEEVSEIVYNRTQGLAAALGEIRALAHGAATATDVEDPDESDVRLHRFAVRIENLAIGATR